MSYPLSQPPGASAAAASSAQSPDRDPEAGTIGEPVGLSGRRSRDALRLLRRFHRSKRLNDVKEVDGRIVFFDEDGSAVWWPGDVPTRFRVHGSEDDERYSLNRVVDFLKASAARVQDMDGTKMMDFMNRSASKRIGDPSSLQAMTPLAKLSKLEEEGNLPRRSRGPPEIEMEVPSFVGSAPEPNEQAGPSSFREDEPANAVHLQETEKKKSEANVDRFVALPDEVVIKIISYLKLEDVATRVSLVSLRFRDLCRDLSLWTRLELPDESRLDTGAATKLIKRCTNLEELNYKNRDHNRQYYNNDNGRKDSRALAIKALKSCPKLKKLVVCSKNGRTTRFERLLKTIGRYGRSLTKFELEGRWSRNAFEANVECFANLTHVKLASNVTEFDLKLLVDHCKRLEHIGLLGIDLTDDVFNYFLEAVQGTLKYLRFTKYLGQLTDASSKNLNKCQKLVSLEICSGVGLRSEGFKAISELTELRVLGISFGSCYEFRSLDYYINHQAAEDFKLFNNLTNLTNLELISSFTNVELKAAVDSCSELTKLTITDCSDISDEGLDYAMLNCRKLTTLEVRGDTSVSMVGLRNIQPSLRELIVKGAWIHETKSMLQQQKVRLETLFPDLKVVV